MSDEQAIDAEERERKELESELLKRRDEALAHVVKFGDPVLKSKASPVQSFGPELRSEVERMISIIRSTSERSSGPKLEIGEALLFRTGSPNLTTWASAASRRSSISTSSRRSSASRSGAFTSSLIGA